MIIKNHACTYLREIKKISGCSGRPYIDGEIWGPYLRPPPALNLALLRSGSKVKCAERGSKHQMERERSGRSEQEQSGVRDSRKWS